MAAILNANSPQNASEVRSFLGLVQYSAKFIPDFAEVAEPLHVLTRKDQAFNLGDRQEREDIDDERQHFGILQRRL